MIQGSSSSNTSSSAIYLFTTIYLFVKRFRKVTKKRMVSTFIGLDKSNSYYVKPQILEALLEKGGRCLVKDENLKTPLHLAAEFSKLKNIDTLLFASTSSVFEKDELGRTPLHYAAMHGRR